MMRNRLLSGPALLAAFLLLFACSTVPLTGRQQLDLVPSSQIMAMSAQEYAQVLDEHTVIRGTDDARMVDRVGNRIRSAVERYLASQNQSQLLQGYNWEFNLIEDKSANAWAMPGGKVAVYTGILPITQDENGLATVLGHEVAPRGGPPRQRAHEPGSADPDGRCSAGRGPLAEPLGDGQPFHVRLWYRQPGRSPAAVQPAPGIRGRPPGADLHGHGRLRSPRRPGLLAAHGCSVKGRPTAPNF